MQLFVLPYPAIDKVAVTIGPVFGWGPLEIRWYGLAYMAGLLFAWVYVKRLLRTEHLWSRARPPFAAELVDDLLLWMTIGVVLGGRLGHILLFQPEIYLTQPAEILKIWRGGMSFHGGLLGAGVVCYLFARRHQISLLSLMDACCAAVPFGLGVGRIANFINAEYWGKVSSAPWAMAFPGAGAEPRHPSQLYEALLEGLVLFAVLRYLTHTRLALRTPGLVTGVFLIGYALARIVCELFREPELGAPFNFGLVTTGMVYSVPMALLGLWLVRLARRSGSAQTT